MRTSNHRPVFDAMKVLYFVLLFFLPLWVGAQTVTGVVYKAGTEIPVPQASVYYSGSMTGTLTNDKGEFILQVKPGQAPIIVSCVGYYSSTIINYVPGQPVKVALDPKTYQLREVVVSNDGMSREDKVRLFMREFIGTSDYALSCTIENIDDVYLAYSKKTKTLTANSSEPLQIENKKLGYHITYFLDRFIKTPSNTSFTGNFIFRESGDASQGKTARNREDSYQGSRMQFIRALWHNNLEAAGFKMYTPLYQPVSPESIVSLNKNSERIIGLRLPVLVSYKIGGGSKNTYLAQTGPSSYIDSSGFYDASLRWTGFMASERVGDMLPFEYKSQKEIRDSMMAKPTGIQSYSIKRLSPEALRIKSIVLVPNSPIDRRMVVKKWQGTVRYKVYGSFGLLTGELDQKLENYFKQLSGITGLDIRKAENERDVNFFILAGNNPNRYADYIGPEALSYLKRDNADGSYYTASEDGFTRMVQMVRLPTRAGMGDPPPDVIWSAVQKQVVKGLGFFRGAGEDENSVFYDALNALPDTVKASDVDVIKALYNPRVKSGMEEREFESTLVSPKEQTVTTDTLSNKIKIFFEKSYIHTDREYYTTGEDIWFKAYLLNGQTNVLSNSSGNLYVELIDPDNKIVQSNLIKLENGLGKGDFKLGDSIAAGIYRIRAYTNWMRNFGDNFIFEKQIHVFADSSLALNNSALMRGAFSVKAARKAPVAAATNAVILQPAAQLSTSTIRFFPEGGSLVEDAAGIVAFKTEDTNGAAIPAKGSLYASTGEKLADFESNAGGMGNFLLFPQSGKNYIAKGTYSSGEAFSVTLPQAVLSGYSMHIRNADSLLAVTITTNSGTYHSPQGNKVVLIGRYKAKACFSTGVLMKELQTTINIATMGLPCGLITVTLYDNAGKPQSERLIYNEGENTASIVLASDKSVYAPRGNVTVNIKAADGKGNPVKANLSLAVTDAGLIPANDGNIVSYLNLQSEIRGKIKNAAQYFDVNNPKRKQSLDLLLLTQGWRDFVWRRLADSALRISYAAENSIRISGRVQELTQNKPVTGANVTLSAPKATGSHFYSARTDSAGRYSINNLQLYGRQLLRLTSRNNKGEPLGRISLDSLFTPLPVNKIARFAIDTMLRTKQVQALALERKKQRYGLSDTIRMKAVIIRSSKTVKLLDQVVTDFGYKDEVFNIDPKDYDHNNLRHYLMHYSTAQLGEVSDQSGQYLLLGYSGPGGRLLFPRMFVNNKELAFTEDDLVMMADYQNLYLSLPVDKIKKVVVKRMLASPKLVGVGIESVNVNNASVVSNGTMTPIEDIYIMYITLQPGALEPELSDVVEANVAAYYQARTFYGPKYETPSSKPDLRSTIHWEPDITTNANGEATITYYNADPKTKVRIVAEGVTESGTPVAGTAIYEVK